MTALVIAALVAASTWLAWPTPARGRLRGLDGRASRGAGTRILLQRLGPWRDRLRIGPWQRRRAAEARMRFIESVSALAAELAAGQAPQAALQRAAGDPPAWPITLAAITLHAPVPAALRADAERAPRSQGALLASIAACWEAAEVSGSGLSAAIGRLATAARQSEEIRMQLAGELAAPRASARLLAALPAFGVLLGIALGIDPLGWLLGSPIGWACLAVAVALIALGLAWTGWIAEAVERQL